VIAHDDALSELGKMGGAPGQFRLADEDDVEQLDVASLEVGEQSQLFELRGAEKLRLVDDEHRGEVPPSMATSRSCSATSSDCPPRAAAELAQDGGELALAAADG
jgi:hypothetical protein